DFFSELAERQARAEREAGTTLRRFRIAGRTVDIRFAGPAMVGLMSDAFAHLAVPAEGKADFTFRVFDEESTGLGPPRPRWNIEEQYSHGEVSSLIDSQRYLQVIQPRRLVIAASAGAGEAVVWVSGKAEIKPWEHAAPLLTLVNWWANSGGYVYVHAGAVGRREGGVLILGRSGAGKSHTALACLRSDLLYVSDDHCLLGTGARPKAASMYATGKLFTHDAPKFPFLDARRDRAIETHEGKLVFFLNDICPDRLAPGLPLKAVLIPNPTGRRETEIVAAPRSAAFFATAPVTALRWPSLGRAAFTGIASALKRLPSYRINTGTDLRGIPQAIGALLDRLA